MTQVNDNKNEQFKKKMTQVASTVTACFLEKFSLTYIPSKVYLYFIVLNLGFATEGELSRLGTRPTTLYRFGTMELLYFPSA